MMYPILLWFHDTHSSKETIPMARIADYLVITDTKHHLQKDGARPPRAEEFKFTLESGAHIGSRAILAFVLKVESGTEDLELEVEVNEVDQVNYTFSDFRSSSTLHEVIDRDLLKADVENTIKFRIEGGTGGVRFSDVVLYYQRDI
jgi:hypothetical protein